MDYGTILVVSSNEEMIASLNNALFEPLRNEPVLASNGRAGLEKALLFSPSVILLDECIADLSDFLTGLRQANINRPVLLLTTDHNCDHIVESFRLGISDFLFLPIQRETALDTVQSALKFGWEQSDREKINEKLLTSEAIQITIATLSHYVNNSLTALSGNLTLLREMIDQDLEKDKALSTIIDGQNNIQYISAVLKVLLNTTNIHYTDYDNSISMIDIEAPLQKELRSINQTRIQ
jgi:FixJ family two-component response regulator